MKMQDNGSRKDETSLSFKTADINTQLFCSNENKE